MAMRGSVKVLQEGLEEGFLLNDSEKKIENRKEEEKKRKGKGDEEGEKRKRTRGRGR